LIEIGDEALGIGDIDRSGDFFQGAQQGVRLADGRERGGQDLLGACDFSNMLDPLPVLVKR
jgi:hypothetical protein